MAFYVNTNNFGYTTIVTPPTPPTTGVTFVVADASLLPTVPFLAAVYPSDSGPLASNAELVLFTGKSGNTLTGTRIQESTSARTVLAGDQLAAVVTNGMLQAIIGALPAQLNVSVPAGYGATGTVGQWAYSDGVYWKCVATDTWVSWLVASA